MDSTLDLSLSQIQTSNSNSNQNGLPKYEDLTHSNLYISNARQSSETRSPTTLNEESVTGIQIDLNEMTTNVEPPKYDELKIINN